MVKRQKRTGKSAAGKRSKAPKSKRAGAGKRRPVRKSKKSKSSSSASSSRGKGTQRGRKASKNSNYNLHMKKTLSQVKAEHPTVSHSEAFKMAAQQWSNSPDNPKNK